MLVPIFLLTRIRAVILPNWDRRRRVARYWIAHGGRLFSVHSRQPMLASWSMASTPSSFDWRWPVHLHSDLRLMKNSIVKTKVRKRSSKEEGGAAAAGTVHASWSRYTSRYTGVANSRAVTIATTRGKRKQVTRHQESLVTAARHSFETPTIAAKARADPTWRLTTCQRSTDSYGADVIVHATRLKSFTRAQRYNTGKKTPGS
jgi:hypothetical protein